MAADDPRAPGPPSRPWLRAGWIAAFAVLAAVRLWNAFTGSLLRGYDDHGHVGYILYLDLYRSVPWADQGWSYFHPPLHYVFGWALAQLESPEALLHGLAFLGGALSLAIAGLAARVTRLASPGRDGLALLAFVAVGLLPVYLYASTMAGNELTAAFFGTLGLALLIANECRRQPLLGRDALAGLAIGLALLSKMSAVLVLAAAGATLSLRMLRERPLSAALRRQALRGEQFLLGRYEHRAIQRQQRLTATHRLTGRRDVQPLDEALDFWCDVRDARLRHVDASNRANRPNQAIAHHGRVDDAKGAFLRRRKLHRLPYGGAGAVGGAGVTAHMHRMVFRRHARHLRLFFRATAGDDQDRGNH